MSMPAEHRIAIGGDAPDFTLPAVDGKRFKLSAHSGKLVVLFFYPKAMTPACTQEACDFRDGLSRFRRHGAVVAGISPDPVQRLEKFAETQELPYPLLSDENLEVSKLYGVWGLKKLYGREYMGIVRSTFLIGRDGKLMREWKVTRVKGHAEEVLEAVRAMK